MKPLFFCRNMLCRTVILGLSLFFFISCSDKVKKRFEEGDKAQKEFRSKPHRASEEDEDFTHLIAPTEDVNDIGVVEELNPEIFVKITILYKRESKKWLKQSQSMSPDEQRRYIESVNRDFFSLFGLTEEEYITYSQKHIDELDAYMRRHPELMSDIME